MIKIAMIQYIFGIPSMRKTIREIEVNFAYRWYLGYGMHEGIPHFSTFGKNYSRHFKDTDLFEKIFSRIRSEAAANGFLDTESLFIDGTHIKASANSHKYRNEVIQKEARSYEKELQEEIERDRQEHGKKPLKEKEKEPEMITRRSAPLTLIAAGSTKVSISRSLPMLPTPVVTRIIIFWILR